MAYVIIFPEKQKRYLHFGLWNMLSPSRLEGAVLNFYDQLFVSLHFTHPKQRVSTSHLKGFTSLVTGFHVCWKKAHKAGANFWSRGALNLLNFLFKRNKVKTSSYLRILEYWNLGNVFWKSISKRKAWRGKQKSLSFVLNLFPSNTYAGVSIAFSPTVSTCEHLWIVDWASLPLEIACSSVCQNLITGAQPLIQGHSCKSLIFFSSPSPVGNFTSSQEKSS